MALNVLPEDDPSLKDIDTSPIIYKEVIESIVIKVHRIIEQDAEVIGDYKNCVINKLSLFQEKASLLDGYIGKLLKDIFKYVCARLDDGDVAIDEINSCSSTAFDKPLPVLMEIVHKLMLVRGEKHTTKFFPHEVDDFERTMYILERIESPYVWNIRFVFISWMCIIVLLPFRFSVMDSTGDIVERLVGYCKAHLSDTGPTRGVVAKLFSVVVCRKDFGERDAVIGWVIDMIKHRESCYRLLVNVYKIGDRDEMAKFVEEIFDLCNMEGSILETKLQTKLIQRAGLTLLKPIKMSWRYKKTQIRLDGENKVERNDNENIVVPSRIEDVLHKLVQGLSSTDKVIRWSAAKGIGRIVERLPMSFGDEVSTKIISIMDNLNIESAYNGANLALAELARRGLLLPEKLEKVVPLVAKSLVFDIRKGHKSIGEDVRDAACYVCWAFARAYESSILRGHLLENLAQNLIITALFDREVSCRRAAAAAFQENVGRQGQFPHGIDIVQAVNFFTITNRFESYTSVALKVAEFEEYRVAIVDHIIKHKLVHWDNRIREQASKTIFILFPLTQQYIQDTYIQDIIDSATDPDMIIRHGSILALCEILRGFAKIKKKVPLVLAKQIREIPSIIDRKRLYRGRIAEKLRISVCYLVKCIALSRLPLKYTPEEKAKIKAELEAEVRIRKKVVVHSLLHKLLCVLEDNIRQPTESIQEAASDAVRVFTRIFVPKTTPKPLVDRLVKSKIDMLRGSDDILARRGNALWLSVLRPDLIRNNVADIVTVLIESTQSKESKELQDSVSRKIAAISLAKVIEVVPNMEQDLFSNAYKALIDGTWDYAIDERGDAGLVVRDACISSLLTIIELNPGKITLDLLALYISALLRQISNRIDKIRHTSIILLDKLLKIKALAPIIPQFDILRKVCSDLLEIELALDIEGYSMLFTSLIPIINIPEYRDGLVFGLVMSMGSSPLDSKGIFSLEEACRKVITESDISDSICTTFDNLWENKELHSIILPSLIASCGVLLETEDALYPVAQKMIQAIQTNILNRSDFDVLRSYTHLSMLASRETPKYITNILTVLQHKYPLIRKYALEQLRKLPLNQEMHNLLSKIDITDTTPEQRNTIITSIKAHLTSQ